MQVSPSESAIQQPFRQGLGEGGSSGQQAGIKQGSQRRGAFHRGAINQGAEAVELDAPARITRAIHGQVLLWIEQGRISWPGTWLLAGNGLTGKVLPQIASLAQVLAGGRGVIGGADLWLWDQRQGLGEDAEVDPLMLKGEQAMAEQVAGVRGHAGRHRQGLVNALLASD